ncbi:helix-turn-helix domain-containing protein [Zhihengliuella sp.]|uniref:helix-turn-helix transcriptional regulator n=1 Tax=Zhihengliuella sp. TaxID=1954483 RepID=UPI002812784F|nr:helix-turn-helix domain-containing protein [Zhihengliuella sp.]
MDDMQRIGDRIRHARKGYGLTQRDLAELIGASERTVREIERGTGGQALRIVVAAANAVGLNVVAS